MKGPQLGSPVDRDRNLWKHADPGSEGEQCRKTHDNGASLADAVLLASLWGFSAAYREAIFPSIFPPRAPEHDYACAAMPALWLFDLDDTILRFSAGQPNFWRHALERQAPQLAEQHARLERLIAVVNHEYWSDDARAFWGRQNMHQARRLVARTALGSEGLSVELCDLIADDMTEAKEAHVRPFDGALDVLQQLRQRGQRMGLLTNGCSAFQRRKLRRYELEPLFELILIEGELGYGKPDARVFRTALEHFGARAEETWMVGDNLSADIAGAQQLGITGIWHDAAGSGLPAGSAVVPERVILELSELLVELA